MEMKAQSDMVQESSCRICQRGSTYNKTDLSVCGTEIEGARFNVREQYEVESFLFLVQSVHFLESDRAVQPSSQELP